MRKIFLWIVRIGSFILLVGFIAITSGRDPISQSDGPIDVTIPGESINEAGWLSFLNETDSNYEPRFDSQLTPTPVYGTTVESSPVERSNDSSQSEDDSGLSASSNLDLYAFHQEENNPQNYFSDADNQSSPGGEAALDAGEIWINGPVDGTFVKADELPESSIAAFMDEVTELGMHIIIIQNMRTKGVNCNSQNCCSMTNYSWLPGLPEKLGLILEEAAKREVEVYVGLVMTAQGICPAAYYVNPNSSLTIEDTSQTVRIIEEQYGQHPAFTGWYIPDEPFLTGWRVPKNIYDYFGGLVYAIREYSDKPILVSPHLCQSQRRTPEEISRRAKTFKESTGIDILLWQDSVGTGAVDIGWGRYESTLDQHFAALSDSLGEDALWAVNELFNCCTSDVLVPGGGAYRPAAITRFALQLTMTAPVSRRVVWIKQHHLGLVDPYHHSEAARMIAAFKAYFGISGEYLIPRSYQWLTPPNYEYADSGNELFDLRTGDPIDFQNETWVGIEGKGPQSVELEVDFGESRSIDWIGLHLLQKEDAGIRFPSQMGIACYTDSLQWPIITSWSLPSWIDNQDGEYVFSNLEPLGEHCQSIRLWADNWWWTFISEVEIISSAQD